MFLNIFIVLIIMDPIEADLANLITPTIIVRVYQETLILTNKSILCSKKHDFRQRLESLKLILMVKKSNRRRKV